MGYWERLRRPVPFEVLEDPAGGTTLLHAEEDQVHGCAKLPLGDCGIRRTMDKAAEREEILQAAIAGVRRVAQAIAALPEGDQERAFAAAKRTYEQTVRDLEYSDDVARSWVSAMMHRLRADVKEVGGGDGRPDESAAS